MNDKYFCPGINYLFSKGLPENLLLPTYDDNYLVNDIRVIYNTVNRLYQRGSLDDMYDVIILIDTCLEFAFSSSKFSQKSIVDLYKARTYVFNMIIIRGRKLKINLIDYKYDYARTNSRFKPYLETYRIYLEK